MSGCAERASGRNLRKQMPVAGFGNITWRLQMSNETNVNDLAKAASELVLRELDEMEARDIFGGDGGWVKVGPIEPAVNQLS